MNETIAVAIGSALGGVARYWISVLTLSISRSLPWGTVLINVAGSFAIGLFGTLTSDGGRMPASHVTRLFFMVGVCGGFTTFSSFSLQTLDLLRAGTPWRALANVALSVLLCLAGVAAGHGVAGALDGGRLATAQAGFTDEEA